MVSWRQGGNENYFSKLQSSVQNFGPQEGKRSTGSSPRTSLGHPYCSLSENDYRATMVLH